MTEYEKEWVADSDVPSLSRIRYGLTKYRGKPVRFLIQLEYWHAGEWLVVARADHDANGPSYQNVERNGIHLDIHHPVDGQVGKITKWSPQPAEEAMGVADDFIRKNADMFVRRFESWL